MGVNRAILLGNLGRDPELRYTSSQVPVCNFSLATTERRRDQAGNWTDHTEWHNVVVWGKIGENCNKFLKKGRQVYIEGAIRTRKWQDKEGRDRYTTEIVANTVQFIGSRGDSRDDSTAAHVDSSDGSAVGNVFDSLETADAVASGGGEDVSFEDDDIPF